MKWKISALIFLFVASTRAALWESFSSDGSAAGLRATETALEGVFGTSPGFSYVGDTRIGGRVRRVDVVVAYGIFNYDADDAFDGCVRVGHFEAYGGNVCSTDFVGIRLSPGPDRTVLARPSIRFNGGMIEEGPAISIPQGEHEWLYEWDPTATEYGVLTLFFKVNGEVVASSRLQLEEDSSFSFFACNAFGIHSGFEDRPGAGAARVAVRQAQYTSLPTPDPRRPGTRLFLLVGDCNVRGRDATPEALVAALPRMDNVYLYTDQWTFAQAPSEPGNFFGPEIGLGRELAAIHRGPVAIIKISAPGRSLEQEWLPGRAGYNRIVAAARQAVRTFRAPQISGLFFVHGEADSANAAWAERYAQNLQRIHAQLRFDLKSPQMPLVTTRLMPYLQTPFRDTVRAAQQSFPWADTDDLGQIGDGVHMNGVALLQAGCRLGQRFREVSGPFPMPNSLPLR